MNGVEASRIIEDTIRVISRRHCIDNSALHEELRPILVTLREEYAEKIQRAESAGRNSGEQSGIRNANLRHWYISQRGFGRIAQGENEAIDRAGIYHIIDSTVRLGCKAPSTINKEINAVQSKLFSCTSTQEVLATLEENRSLICDSFGIANDVFNNCLEDINELSVPTSEEDLDKQLSRLSTAIHHISTHKDLT